MLLEIRNLKTSYSTTRGDIRAVDGVSLDIEENEVFGVAGESGCGKTTLIKTLLNLLPAGSRRTADRLRYKGRDLLAMGEREFREEILWKEISLVPQSAMNSLNPVYRVGEQIVEAIRTHMKVSRRAARQRVGELFEDVGLQPSLMDSYPHEFSGGMRQRAMIAMALALEPGLIVMDEPTTGLDVLVQERILRRLGEIRAHIKSSILLITHDISVIAELSDHIAIMYAGRIMERADALTIFEAPYHPYTLGLKNAFPSIQALERELVSIPGAPPNLLGGIEGCVFKTRCPFAIDRCWKERPAQAELKPGHEVACLRTDDVHDIRRLATQKETWRSSKSIA